MCPTKIAPGSTEALSETASDYLLTYGLLVFVLHLGEGRLGIKPDIRKASGLVSGGSEEW